MTVRLKKAPAGATPLHAVERAQFAALAAQAPAATRRWFESTGFEANADTFSLVPGPDGAIREVWAGIRARSHPFALAALPKALPPGRYALAGDGVEPEAAALSWALGAYTFERYKRARREPASLFLPSVAEARRGMQLAEAVMLTRNLVNTPAEEMGPQELAEAARRLARQHGAKFRQVVGERLLDERFPAVHAVGRAAAREPRLIELRWGQPRHPKLVLVGKGVCFDTGGLDLKTADGMRWMKKDMGGAAHALALASLVMAQELPVQLQVLVPAVENAVAGNAYRPGDVIHTRKGLHIEIGNTDAEGRVILCDALAYAAEGRPDLIIDLATLTGAARVALGPQLPALFCRDITMARQLVDMGLALHDPLWHLPLWRDYHGGIESDIADIVNTGRSGMAGAITAALFLEDFVPEGIDWLHLDLFAWNDAARPGRPVGGEAQTLRTLIAWLQQRYAR